MGRSYNCLVMGHLVAKLGVCILFNPSLDVTIIQCLPSTNGRFVIAEVNTFDKIIVCIYGPNLDSADFFQELLQILCNNSSDSIIMGGDFNFVLNLNLDKQGGNLRTNFNARSKCLEIMSTLDLIDIWRDKNPFQKIFTWRSNISPDICCRLDIFLISRKLGSLVTRCFFLPVCSLIIL